MFVAPIDPSRTKTYLTKSDGNKIGSPLFFKQYQNRIRKLNKRLSNTKNRTWVCPACGAVNDRDILAARNILRKGISELESKSNSNDSNVGVSCVGIQESHSL